MLLLKEEYFLVPVRLPLHWKLGITLISIRGRIKKSHLQVKNNVLLPLKQKMKSPLPKWKSGSC